MAESKCCLINKTSFDKPIGSFNQEDDIVIDISSIQKPRFVASYSGIWRPIFYTNKLYDDDNIGYSYIGKPDNDKDLEELKERKKTIIGIYNAVKVERSQVYNWEAENLSYAVHWVPYTGYYADRTILGWYRYYDIDRRTDRDPRIWPGVDLYISYGDYWRISGVHYVSDNLKHDASKISDSLKTLGKYTPQQIDEYSKILATGPQLDWITEVLSSGDPNIPRSEYGLDMEKLRQMSIKDKKDFGSPRYVFNKKDLFNALSNKYKGYFYIGPGNTMSLTSKFEVDNDDISISLPLFSGLIKNDDDFGYIDLKVQVGTRTIEAKNVHQNIDISTFRVGKLRDLDTPFYTGVPVSGGTPPALIGNKLVRNTDPYYVFELKHNTSQLQYMSVPHNKKRYFHDYSIPDISLHSQNGIRLTSRNRPIPDNTTYAFYSLSEGQSTQEAMFFDNQSPPEYFNKSNIKITITKNNSNHIYGFSVDEKTHTNELTVYQLRNSGHLTCKPFIKDIPINRNCQCARLMDNNPLNSTFTNRASYIPNVSILPNIQSYGGLSEEEVSLLEINKLEYHPEPGFVFEDNKFGDLNNTTDYNISGKGDFHYTFFVPQRIRKIDFEYIIDVGSITVTTPAQSITTSDQNGILCLDKNSTGGLEDNPLNNISVTVSAPPSSSWGFSIRSHRFANIWENVVLPNTNILYPMIYVQPKDISTGFLHPNKGWISSDSPDYNDNIRNKSCLIPYRYGDRHKEQRLVDYRPYLNLPIDNGTHPYNRFYKNWSPIIFLPMDSAYSQVSGVPTKLFDTIYDINESGIGLLAYNNEKLYNKEYLPGLNFMINVSGSGYDHTKELIDKSTYFGFSINGKNNQSIRYVTKDFHKFQYTKEKCPILEHIDFDFKTISNNTGIYPYNDLYIKEKNNNNTISIDNTRGLPDRAWSFFDEPTYGGSQLITVIPATGQRFSTVVSNISGNRLTVTNIPQNINLIGAKIYKNANRYEKSLLISRNFITNNDDRLSIGKWGHLINYSPYAYSSGINKDKYNIASQKIYRNNPAKEYTVIFPNNIETKQSGETYNPYLGWAGSMAIRNYNAKGELLPENKTIFYNPTNRLLSNDNLSRKYLESVGIGHLTKAMSYMDLPFISGDNIIAFHDNIKNNEAYFFTGNKIGKIGIAVTLNKLSGRGRLTLQYGNTAYECSIDGNVPNELKLQINDPYYFKPIIPSGLSSVYNLVDLDIQNTIIYSSGDIYTLKLVLNKQNNFPVFGKIKVESNTDSCLSFNSLPPPWGFQYTNKSLIDSIVVFSDDPPPPDESDRVCFYRHEKDHKDYYPFLDMHLYNNDKICPDIYNSGIINFENVFQLRTEPIHTDYDYDKYIIDIQNNSRWGILTKQNWYIDPDDTLLIATNFQLLGCSNDTAEYFNGLCSSKTMDIEESLDALGLNIEDFILEEIDYRGHISNLDKCCINGIINITKEQISLYGTRNLQDIWLSDTFDRDYCGNGVENVQEVFESSGMIKSPTDCREFDLKYTISAQGYKIKINQEKILSRLQPSEDDQENSHPFFFGTGNFVSIQPAVKFYIGGNKLYRSVPPITNSFFIDSEINNYSSAYYAPFVDSFLSGPRLLSIKDGFEFITDKSYVPYTEQNCRASGLPFTPFLSEWINYQYTPTNNGLSYLEQFFNEIRFREHFPHKQKISAPLVEYNRDTDGKECVVEHSISISSKKCFPPTGPLFSLTVEGQTYNFSYDRDDINMLYIKINEHRFTSTNNVPVRFEVEYQYKFDCQNEYDSFYKDYSDNVLREGNDIKSTLYKPLVLTRQPIMAVTAAYSSITDDSTPLSSNIFFYGSKKYNCLECPGVGDDCSAIVRYWTGDYEEFPIEVSLGAGTVPFLGTGYIGIHPKQKEAFDAALVEYNETCKDATTEWTVSMKGYQNVIVCPGIDAYNNIGGGLDEQPDCEPKSVQVTTTTKKKANPATSTNRVDNDPIIRWTLIENENCPPPANIHEEIAVNDKRIKNCCNTTDIGFSTNINILIMHDLIEIFLPDINAPKLYVQRSPSSFFKCPEISVTLLNDNLVLSDGVTTSKHYGSIGGI